MRVLNGFISKMIVLDLFCGSCMVSASVIPEGHSVRLVADVVERACVKDVPTAVIDLDETPSQFIEKHLSDVDFEKVFVSFNCYETRFIRWSIEFIMTVKPGHWCMAFGPRSVTEFVRHGVDIVDMPNVRMQFNVSYRNYGVPFKGIVSCVTYGCSTLETRREKGLRLFKDKSLGMSLDYLLKGRNKMRVGIGTDDKIVSFLSSPTLTLQDGLSLYARVEKKWVKEKVLDNEDFAKLLYFDPTVLNCVVNLTMTTLIPRIVVSLLDI